MYFFRFKDKSTFFNRNYDFIWNFNDFGEKLDCRSILRRRLLFTENNFVCLSLSQIADFVCNLKPHLHGAVFVLLYLTVFVSLYLTQAGAVWYN